MHNDNIITLILHYDKYHYGSSYEYPIIIESDTNDKDDSETDLNCHAFLPLWAKTNHPINKNEPKCTFTTV